MRASTLAVLATCALGAAAQQTYTYSTVPGFFAQDDPNTDPSTFDPVRRPVPLRTRSH